MTFVEYTYRLEEQQKCIYLKWNYHKENCYYKSISIVQPGLWG